MLSYLRLRPCITARGPVDTDGSLFVRQLLKSAHWTKESPLSAIRVLRRKKKKKKTIGHVVVLYEQCELLCRCLFFFREKYFF